MFRQGQERCPAYYDPKTVEPLGDITPMLEVNRAAVLPVTA